MAGSVNRCIIIGRVGKDPETRTMNDGSKIVNLSVVTSESWRDRTSGERKEKSEWHRVAIFNEKIVEIVERYVHKGSRLYIEGQLQTRKYVDSAGQEKSSTEIVLQRFRGEITLLDDAPPTRDDRPVQTQTSQTRAPVRQGEQRASALRYAQDDMDDEIPF